MEPKTQLLLMEEERQQTFKCMSWLLTVDG